MTSPAQINRFRRMLDDALGHVQGGRFAKAAPLLKELTQKLPRHPLPWNLMGIVASESGRLDDAVRNFQQAVAIAPREADFHNNLGEALRKSGDLDQAEKSFRAALALNPDHAAARNNIGAVLNTLHREEEATEHLLNAVRLKPNNYEAFTNLGISLINRHRAERAILCFEQALAFRGLEPVLVGYYQLALRAVGRFDRAFEILATARAQFPDDIDLAVAEIHVAEEKGEHRKAYDALLPLLATHKDKLAVARAFAVLASRYRRSEEAVEMLLAVAREGRLTRPQEQGVCFDLGRLLDSANRFDEAFAWYARGNALNDRPNDHARMERNILSLKTIFSPDRLGALARARNQSEMPVFIVGMPRSGTTLAEQILDCHPAVHGAGELSNLREASEEIGRALKTPYPECLPKADADLLDRFAARILDDLERRGGGSPRVINKMPHNFLSLGLIWMLFPRARIIHMRRDPLDTCLSCFFQLFYAEHAYSFDLGDLGAHYRGYRDLMGHWLKVLDLDILEVDYEQLVTDQQATSRWMVDFLGLPWDDRCLAFDRSARPARTASYDQVRQPIYDRSVGRWRHYAHHLGPLIEALGDLAPADAPHPDPLPQAGEGVKISPLPLTGEGGTRREAAGG